MKYNSIPKYYCAALSNQLS